MRMAVSYASHPARWTGQGVEWKSKYALNSVTGRVKWVHDRRGASTVPLSVWHGSLEKLLG